MKNFCNDIGRHAGDESEKKAVIWRRHVLIKKGDGQFLRLAKYFHSCVFFSIAKKSFFCTVFCALLYPQRVFKPRKYTER